MSCAVAESLKFLKPEDTRNMEDIVHRQKCRQILDGIPTASVLDRNGFGKHDMMCERADVQNL